MKIVVCIKQVPDTSEVKIDPVTHNLVREGVHSIMNPFDERAVEEALRVRDKAGGKVTAVSMGPRQAVQALQNALDMGADRAILLTDPAFVGSDTLATGYALSTLIKTLRPDLVLCGAEAIDGCTGQVGPIIAENLGFPQFTYVSKIGIEGMQVSIEREKKEGYELYCAKIPVLICVLKEINKPRKAAKSNKKPEIMTIGDFDYDRAMLGLEGSPTRVARIEVANKKVTSYVVIDSSLPADQRIKAIINGGITPKKIKLTRGTPEYLAAVIMQDNVLSANLTN